MLEIAIYIGGGLALAAAVLVGYAATRPDTFRTARSVRIAASRESVFPLIADLKQLARWNPFEPTDPATLKTYTGPDGGVGQRYTWEGNRQTGKGNIVVTDVTPPSKVVMSLNMLAPIAAQNRVEFTLRTEGNDTDVTWAMEGAMPLFMRVMNILFNMDCGDQFEVGLARLKVLAEGGHVRSVDA